MNPSIQDFISALYEGPRAALRIYKDFTERQFQAMKIVLDACEELLPLEIKIAWKAVEAIHDERQEK